MKRAGQPHTKMIKLTAVTAMTILTGPLLVGCGGSRPGEVPRGAMGDYVRGALARERGDDDAALANLLTAVQEDPSLRMANLVLGDIYVERGQYEQAEPYYNRMTRLDPYWAENFFKLGWTYEQLERFRDAVGSYERGLALEPEAAAGLAGAGRSYVALGEYSQGLNYLQRAVEVDPTLGTAWLNLGLAQDALGQTENAEQSYRRALETLQGPPFRLLAAFGDNLVRQGEGGEAEQFLRQALAMQEDLTARKRLGDALALQGQYEAAGEQYEQVLATEPNDVATLNARGAVLIRQYQQGLELDDALRQRALGFWERSLEVNPNQPDVRAALEGWRNRGL